MLGKILLHLLCFLFIFPLIAAAQIARDGNLSEYRWKNRLLLVFAPNPDFDSYKKQLQELDKDKGGMSERDMRVFHLFERGDSRMEQAPLGENEIQALYKRYQVSRGDFTVILIGKDGTEKLRRESVLSLKKLFAVIDAMPMRQREMRQNDR